MFPRTTHEQYQRPLISNGPVVDDRRAFQCLRDAEPMNWYRDTRRCFIYFVRGAAAAAARPTAADELRRVFAQGVTERATAAYTTAQ